MTAHYDHLGTGWPDVHKGDEGQVHPGADDNASGVAVMLELAHALAAAEKPSAVDRVRGVHRRGGRPGRVAPTTWSTPGPSRSTKTIGVINLDTVGRLGEQRLSVLGTGTASEWQHIFRGAGFVTGVESRNIPESIQASDQVSFIRKGVPAVQIFAGAHADYHRPSDTADKIDHPGLVKVATFVREGVVYLAERAEPMTVTIAAPSPASRARRRERPSQAAAADGRSARELRDRARFRLRGAGRACDRPGAGSAAEKAGIQAGDVLTALDGKPIANLQGYSELLKTLTPGQTVRVTVLRQGKELTLEATLGER